MRSCKWQQTTHQTRHICEGFRASSALRNTMPWQCKLLAIVHKECIPDQSPAFSQLKRIHGTKKTGCTPRFNHSSVITVVNYRCSDFVCQSGLIDKIPGADYYQHAMRTCIFCLRRFYNCHAVYYQADGQTEMIIKKEYVF